MNSSFKDYRPLIMFLAKFAVSYIILSAIYYGYLSNYNEAKFEVDPFTKVVAEQTKSTLLLFGSVADIVKHSSQAAYRLSFSGKTVARVIEGCNGISVAILFAAFVIAFKGKLWQTILFIIGGSLVIHVLNIARIAMLAALLYHFPQYEHILHGVIFPAIIYGVVFLLWVIWVNKFSIYATNPK